MKKLPKTEKSKGKNEDLLGMIFQAILILSSVVSGGFFLANFFTGKMEEAKFWIIGFLACLFSLWIVQTLSKIRVNLDIIRKYCEQQMNDEQSKELPTNSEDA